MNIPRDWATPITAGAFLLSAATGILIFFHADIGLNKAAHEWLGWLLLGGVALHTAANFSAFKRHLATRRGQLLIGVFALVLAASFFGSGEHREHPFEPSIRALSQAPLTTLSQLAHVSPEQLRQRLAKAGVQPMSDEQSLRDLVGSDLQKQMRVLETLFTEAK